MPTVVPGTLPTVPLMDPRTRWISTTCRLVPGLEETYVYIGDALFTIVPEGDAYSAKFATAHLVQLQVASAEAIARASGFPSTSLREWVAQLRRTGTLTPSDFKPGPVGPRKMTPEIFHYCRVSRCLATKTTVCLTFLDQCLGGKTGISVRSWRASTFSVDSPSRPSSSCAPNSVFMAPGIQPSRLKRSRKVRLPWPNNVGLDITISRRIRRGRIRRWRPKLRNNLGSRCPCIPSPGIAVSPAPASRGTVFKTAQPGPRPARVHDGHRGGRPECGAGVDARSCPRSRSSPRGQRLAGRAGSACSPRIRCRGGIDGLGRSEPPGASLRPVRCGNRLFTVGTLFHPIRLRGWTAAHPWTEDHQFAPLTTFYSEGQRLVKTESLTRGQYISYQRQWRQSLRRQSSL